MDSYGRRLLKMDLIAQYISIDRILDLPWYVGITGLVLAALALWSGVWSLITLKISSALVRFAFCILVLVILTRNGQDIVWFLQRTVGGLFQ